MQAIAWKERDMELDEESSSSNEAQTTIVRTTVRRGSLVVADDRPRDEMSSRAVEVPDEAVLWFRRRLTWELWLEDVRDKAGVSDVF
jgi:hypothetical protein